MSANLAAIGHDDQINENRHIGMSFEPKSAAQNRSLRQYSVLIFVTICAGLGSRKFAAFLPSILKKNAGDILWAVMVYLIVGFLIPRLSILRVTAIAASFSFFIEFFKYYHAPWIDAFRRTRISPLILGGKFMWSNLVCYGIGILIAAGFELWLAKANPDLNLL